MSRDPLPAQACWLHALLNVFGTGAAIRPRNMPTREMLAQKSIIDMTYPVIGIPERKLNYKFMVEEALWILSGSNRAHHQLVRPYSDNGRVMQGAYGPKVTEQMQYVLEKLAEDPDSRQAVISTWREAPRSSRDVPCTLSIQFLLREKLDIVVTMRSQDLWLGYPYDVFCFTMIAWYVLLLGHTTCMISREIRRGTMYLTAGSSHLYERNIPGARKCIESPSAGSKWAMSPPHFDTPENLIAWLESLRDASADDRKKALGA